MLKIVELRNHVLAYLTMERKSSKGDPAVGNLRELLAADESLNFIGNVEARDLMNGVADICCSEWFSQGNAVLKSIEGTAIESSELPKTANTSGGLQAKLGATLLRIASSLKKRAQLLQMLVEPVLFGVKGTCCQDSCGSSDAKAVYGTIRQIRTMLETDVVAQTAREFSRRNKR